MSPPTNPLDSPDNSPGNSGAQRAPVRPPEPVAHALFRLGLLVATPGALQLLARLNVDPMALVRRHAQGDWGDLCSEDARTNHEALIQGFRLLSSYNLAGNASQDRDTSSAVVDEPDAEVAPPESAVIWIITEADRSVTTLLLPREY